MKTKRKHLKQRKNKLKKDKDTTISTRIVGTCIKERERKRQ